MYIVWINTPINFSFSDDSVFLKKNLGGGHKFSEFACFSDFLHFEKCLLLLTVTLRGGI